jgi:hypothetical protein
MNGMLSILRVARPNPRVQRTRVARCARPRLAADRHPLGGRERTIVRTGSLSLLLGLLLSGGCGDTVSDSPAPSLVVQTPVVVQLTPTVVVYKIEGDVVAPRLVSRVAPPIPDRCRKARLDSSVIIYEATILETGDVAEVTTLKAPNSSPPCPELETAAHTAISQWKYEPATLHGKPVRVRLTITQTLYLR